MGWPAPLPPEVTRRLRDQNCVLVTTAGDLPHEIEAKSLHPLVARLPQAIATR